MKKASYFIILLGFLTSCQSNVDFDVKDFNPFSNFQVISDTLNLPMDLNDAATNGIVLPSKNQCKLGYFKISFKVKNNADQPKPFYYKIFYQNDSYKFIESLDGKYNKLASNNFYGSWLNAKDRFHKTPIIPNDDQFHIVTDSFKIIGNPRDEKKYFGSETVNNKFSDKLVKQTIDQMRNDTAWFNNIKVKSLSNNISINQQLLRDAKWILNKNISEGNFNNRWKRNPYVGNYKFVLLIASRDKLLNAPETIKNISKSEKGVFKNPFYYFNYQNKYLKNNQLEVLESKKILKTKANFNLGSGLYVSETNHLNQNFDISYYTNNCNSSDEMFNTAQFEQYFHNINANLKFKNIPIIYDVVDDNYSRNQYTSNLNKFSKDEFIRNCITISKSPGRTVHSDTKNNKILIKTPGNSSKPYSKENVGVNSRIGFTYGKFIAKIKFPSIINKDNIWNGLTCAYWLKFQEEAEWNFRMPVDPANLGYLSKSCDGSNCERLRSTHYSEIDFEILKTSEFWPKTSYSSNKKTRKDKPSSNQNIIITCTNWDMACRIPKKFNIGAKDYIVDGKNFTVHRWDDWYKALTIKSAIHHNNIFNRAYYYEIDWQPDKIIWRIGPDIKNMKTVAYMDNSITSVPNNQMVIVFTQEFHDTEWWPLSPFIQEMIPFPKKDIQGEILELYVE